MRSLARALWDPLSALAGGVGRKAATSQWVVRAVILLSPFVVLAAGAASGAALHWWFVALLALVAVTASTQPASSAPMVALVVLVLFWWLASPASNGWPVLLAAAAVVALHVAAALAALAPAGVPISADLVRLWLVRGGVLYAVAVLAWSSGRLPAAGNPLAQVPALLLVAAVGVWAVARYGRRTPQ